MRKKQSQLCRLCLSVITNDNFDKIGENIKEMLEVLQLKVHINTNDEHLVCSNCMERIQGCLDFKSIYLSTEDFIISFYNSESKTKLDLRELYYLHKNKQKSLADIAQDQQICRMCMKLGNSISCKPFIKIEENMIPKYIPEVNINLTKEPVICDTCLNSLKCCSQFLQICMNTEENIIKYCKFKGIGNEGPINLNNVVQFTKSTSECERDITEVDELCYENSENIIDKTEVTVEKENGENVKNDTKADIEESITDIKIKKEPLELQSGEWEEIYIKTEDKNIVNMDIKKEPFELQTEKLEMIDEQNKSEADFGSCQDAPTPSQTFTKDTKTGMYKCESCSYVSKHSCNLKKHMLIHRELSEVTVHSCDQCSFKTKYKQSLTVHALTHRNTPALQMIKRSINSRVYNCESCSYSSPRISNLKKHLLTHLDLSEVTLHSCGQCAFKTKYEQSLKGHMLKHRQLSEVPLFKCESCSYVTKHKSNINSHVLAHTTEYKCASCSYVAKQKGHLKTHMLIHRQLSEVTVYRCNSCPYITKHKSSLKNHCKNHVPLHASSKARYKCKSCSYVTKYRHGLRRHLLTHKKCDKCSFTTKYKSCLEVHMLTHRQLSK